jgi:hypothetical protein
MLESLFLFALSHERRLALCMPTMSPDYAVILLLPPLLQAPLVVLPLST